MIKKSSNNLKNLLVCLHRINFGFQNKKVCFKRIKLLTVVSFVEHGSMALEQNTQDGDFDEANNQGVSLRIYPPLARPFCRIWEGSKNLFCSGVFLKGSAFAVGLWNPKKGVRSVAMAFVFLLQLLFVLNSFCHAFLCRPSDAPKKFVVLWKLLIKFIFAKGCFTRN